MNKEELKIRCIEIMNKHTNHIYGMMVPKRYEEVIDEILILTDCDCRDNPMGIPFFAAKTVCNHCGGLVGEDAKPSSPMPGGGGGGDGPKVAGGKGGETRGGKTGNGRGKTKEK